jgi:hypothetical protein
MNKDELNEVTECRECGKRIPQRNNQVGFACRMHRLCRSCYEAKFAPQGKPGNAPVAVWPAKTLYDGDEYKRNPIRDTTAWEFLDEFFGGDR